MGGSTTTARWYETDGHILIQDRVDKYAGMGLGLWLSNFDLVPAGVEYKDLQGMITECPCKYVEQYDDIVLFV